MNEFDDQKAKVDLKNEALKYLEDNGIGSGTNITSSSVVYYLIDFHEQQQKKIIRKLISDYTTEVRILKLDPSIENRDVGYSWISANIIGNEIKTIEEFIEKLERLIK